MPTVSTSYSAEIAPDPRLRRLVLQSGAALALAGFGLALLLPLTAWPKAAVAVAWLGLSAREWLAMRRGYERSGTLRITANGGVERQCRDGSWRTARLCAGSLVLPRLAWLRIAPEGMRPYAELVRGNMRQSEDWRRLQVIWRHVGAA